LFGRKEEGEKKGTDNEKRIKGAILLLRQKKGFDLVSFVLKVKHNNSAVITVRVREQRDNNFHPSYIVIWGFFQVRKQQ
jgi:hypothetical protein